MKKIRRNYQKLVNEICNLQNSGLQFSIIGYVSYYSAKDETIYPIIKLENRGKRKYTAVIQSGMHGDEVEGVQVLLRWMQEIKKEFLDEISFTIFPCMNPYGYQNVTRTNGNKQEVNIRLDQSNEVKELEIYKQHYPKEVDLFIDVHGDCGRYGKTEIYAYERILEGKESPTMKAFKEHDKLIPYIKEKTIYSEPCKNGVLNKSIRDDSIQDYMTDNGCECSITLEIPGRFKGFNKISGSVEIMKGIISNFLKFKNEGKI